MKNLFIIIILFLFIGCYEKPEKPIAKYKEGDIVCTKIGNQKGIIINAIFVGVYDIRFYNTKQNTVSIGGHGGGALISGGNGGNVENNFYRIDNMREFEFTKCGEK
jgi:hypothetical protein